MASKRYVPAHGWYARSPARRETDDLGSEKNRRSKMGRGRVRQESRSRCLNTFIAGTKFSCSSLLSSAFSLVVSGKRTASSHQAVSHSQNKAKGSSEESLVADTASDPQDQSWAGLFSLATHILCLLLRLPAYWYWERRRQVSNISSNAVMGPPPSSSPAHS